MDPNTQSSPASEQLVAAFNDIGFKLLSAIAEKGGERNILISPLSLSFALCMLYNGAGGETRRSVQDVLAARDFALEEINDACRALRSLLLSADDRVLLKCANALWAHEGLRFDEVFVRTVKQSYAAEARSLDFNDPSSLAVINEWASEQTEGKINPLLNSDDISAATECVISSAVYFKGAWAAPFSRDSTREEPFYLQSGQTRDVPMMQRAGRYQFHQSLEFQAVSLPYGGGRLSMYIFLPAEGSSPSELSKRMDNQAWQACLARLEEKHLLLYLPRFRLTYEADLSDPLASLGLSIMFASGADFSLMGLGGHYVEKFKHKTMAEVSEEGTEAAAVSAVMMGRSLPPSRTLKINRPFFWAIRDNLSGALIFTSVVVEPDS